MLTSCHYGKHNFTEEVEVVRLYSSTSRVIQNGGRISASSLVIFIRSTSSPDSLHPVQFKKSRTSRRHGDNTTIAQTTSYRPRPR